MVSNLQIREKMLEYLSGALGIEVFEDWVAQNTWNVHQWGDKDTQNLAHELDAKLAEYSSDLITEDQLQESLRGMARNDLPSAASSGKPAGLVSS